jgi:hypothetical protein
MWHLVGLPVVETMTVTRMMHKGLGNNPVAAMQFEFF